MHGSSLSAADRLLNYGANSLLGDRTTRTKLVRVGLVILILLNFRTFEYFPGLRILQDAWYGLSLVVFVVLYPLFKIASGWTFSKVELYLLVTLPVLFIIPAFTANAVFGQPLFYGIFPQRSALTILWWIMLINAWRLKWVRETDVEAALVFVCWGTFFLFNALRFGLDPNRFDQVGFTVGTGAEATFTFTAFFALFGVLYYVLKGLRQRRAIYYLIGAIQLVSAVGHSGRSLIAVTVLTLLVFLFRWRGFRASIPALLYSTVAISAFVGVLLLVSPTATRERLQKFEDAFQVATGASEVQDISANARVFETDTAKPYIAAHPLFGVGAVSQQWQGGLVAAVGEYFVPGDIGFVGILFTYGAFGLVILASQYFFAFHSRGNTKPTSSSLLDASRAFVLFSALYSTVTGLFVFNMEVSTFFIIITSLMSARPAEIPVSVETQEVYPPVNALQAS